MRDHTALYLSYENEGDFEEYLFDPDGGYTPQGGFRQQQYAKGDFNL